MLRKERIMQFVPYRDLRNEPSTLRKKLASEGELVVTVDNKPFAVMINLEDENVQDVLLMVTRLRAQMAARSIRSQARRDGLDKMSLKDVNAIIKKSRAARKR
jgi:PHD/YefM family antitoxin component YafN of YafNO toxin-antitoxin module